MIDKNYLLSKIRDVPDFPKPGIIFKDITPLLGDSKAFRMVIDHLKERYKDRGIDYIAGIESRGFIFGAALAYALEVGFVPIRKKGKLPYTTVSEKYSLEYGFDEIEIHIDAFGDKKSPKVVLIDDLLATGGTAEAAAKLLKKVGANLIEATFLIELKFLDGAKRVQKIVPLYSILEIA